MYPFHEDIHFYSDMKYSITWLKTQIKIIGETGSLWKTPCLKLNRFDPHLFPIICHWYWKRAMICIVWRFLLCYRTKEGAIVQKLFVLSGSFRLNMRVTLPGYHNGGHVGFSIIIQEYQITKIMMYTWWYRISWRLHLMLM